ncbi:unnamed protein product [Spirodela intermedia]|uniref:1,3-beta-glucan synthase n=1 Tax=Spirodela intermedia TaxID=51605 RepID=A0A7I8KYP5_SPIIN|nr:unnamed protein product [Spirodela intermedia]
MASSSGTKGPVPRKSLSRKITRLPTMIDAPEDDVAGADSEFIPSSLSSIAPILRVANELEEEYPRIAYFCRFAAFERIHNMDKTSSGRGVRQFKTYLLHKLEKEDMGMVATNNLLEVINFYRYYYKTFIEGPVRRKPEEMAKHYQVATILFDILKRSGDVDTEIEGYASKVERNKVHYAQYNILPIRYSGTPPAIMKISEIKAAVNALCETGNLPTPKLTTKKQDESENSSMLAGENRSIHDLLDWLGLTFGFQKGNVENQREHLILLLANVEMRMKREKDDTLMEIDHVKSLMGKVFKNYETWCAYLRENSNIKYPKNPKNRQFELLYIALHFLIWGEASNIRFMPECLCYIFHKMAGELYSILNPDVGRDTGEKYNVQRGEEWFLKEVITPIYNVLHKESQRNNRGTASHSKWRNYDDLNELFWSEECLKLDWPLKPKGDFFAKARNRHSKMEDQDRLGGGRRKPKTNFVEIRTFWHLFRSFDRMWIFFILALQAMVIVAWSPSGSPSAIFDADVFRGVLSIFITAALLNFIQAALDIVLSWKAWGNMHSTQIVRYLLKLVVAIVWLIILPIGYSGSMKNPTGLVKFFSNWLGNLRNQTFFSFAVALYLIPNIVSALLFLLPRLQRKMELSNWRIVIFFLWWSRPKLYVGRGMHEDTVSLIRYTLFWILLLISKLAFSYYVEISPLIEPTKVIMNMRISNYEWHEFFPNVKYNIGVVISLWAPIVLVYFMDAQIWYAIFATLYGGILGAFSRLGEIRTLGMLRSRFETLPSAFSTTLVPLTQGQDESHQPDTISGQRIFAIFSQVWNEFIYSLRTEDLISNKEKDLLLMSYTSDGINVFQWPPFLLASKIPVALGIAKDIKRKDDAYLFKKIKNDGYMWSAVIECYQTLKMILFNLLVEEKDKEVLEHICSEVKKSIIDRRFLRTFRMSELPQLSNKLDKFLNILKGNQEDDSYRAHIINVLQDIMEIITRDIMMNGYGLHLLITIKESAIDVPINLDARRRITFFANSLFMNMPRAPEVCNMLSFSVLTPYYNEEVLYSEDDLNLANEDGITVLFYLQKIYPDEWKNFLERIDVEDGDIEALKQNMDKIRYWVSYRGQTLSRTVRGMMYYRHAIKLQGFLDMLDDTGGLRTGGIEKYYHEEKTHIPQVEALADMKFTYVVSCQVYGMQKKSTDGRDYNRYRNVLNLMLTYPSLRVAYIDEREEATNKVYYSVLVKGGEKLDEEIYRIKLPGRPNDIGEGKPENQNHAIIFTRGEALQTIDMNQDNYLEEAFKMRNVLEELTKSRRRQHKPTILGLREHIFTGSVSSLAWFMSNQETSFVTIGQRILANPLKVRFHYGHPDIFDRIFHITRGGISKASKTINLSEDIFSGYNSTLRGGNVTHHEYIQVGKGRDVGLNQISSFEAKVANGNGEQTISRDVYRLGHRFDFYRMLSFYFTTVGFYFSSMVTVLTVYTFLYGRLYMVMSGLERAILDDPVIQQNRSLEAALASQSVFQLGLLLVLPMVMEIGLEKGFRTALGKFIIMQLQLASVFFTFQLGTKAHYYGRTILHGGAKYRATGRGFVVFHAKFADNYRMYSRSHFVKGLELVILLVVYLVYGTGHSSGIYLFVTFSMWFLVASWLFAPFVFNPSGFEWQKTVDDWTDWNRWVGNLGGIGIAPERSWESWWDMEQDHLRCTGIRGRVLEILLALRFLLYQYGIVYHLNIAHHSKSVVVYGLSWLVMVIVLLVLKMVSMGRRKFGIDFQLMFRILKGLLFLGFLSVMAVLFVVCGLTISDLFAGILGFMPTGWAILLIGQVCRPFLMKVGFWESIKELARTYEYVMGLIIFTPIAILSWFPFVSEFQSRLLFNQAFSRGLQISMILTGRKDGPMTQLRSHPPDSSTKQSQP